MGLERRPSNSYGHHRQTSIVHGMQHSRNPSVAGSTASTSPLSPELIASLGRGGFDEAVPGKLDQHDAHANYSSSAGIAGAHGVPGSLSTIQDSDADAAMSGGPASLVHMRMNSGVSRRERSHSRSHSKHHSESKTVGEYALHHLFNSVGTRYLQGKLLRWLMRVQFVGQADSKINQAILKLGESDAPVEEVCGPGADPNFDQLISALGHIARQKPKPLIDTIMVWRKAKGDAAITARQMTSEQVQSRNPMLSPNRAFSRDPRMLTL